MQEESLTEIEELRSDLWSSFLLFTETFFPLVVGREFILSNPVGRESHFITIAREMMKVANLETTSLLINVPPGYGKSVLMSMFVAWTLSRWPNSQYLYISYGHDLASKHTAFIKRIIESSYYRDTFDIHLRKDTKAKDAFSVTEGGSIKAFGSSGAVTGCDAGIPGLDEFSGCIILDDLHKPDEVHSDTIRQGVIDNYKETILQRCRAPNVPIICIAQRLHEDDICAHMLSGKDERQWKHVCLKSLDEVGNALYPEVNTQEQLLEKQDKNPYVFSSQYQQEPIPSGGALYRLPYFPILEQEPQILTTFITADTAETSNQMNDACAFSFWGVYKINEQVLGLHWLDCVELFIEPKDLKDEFLSFYTDCCRYKVKPLVAAIEKKSTGVTLISTLQDIRGLQVRDIKRTAASYSKANRFIMIQQYVAAKLISFPYGAKHTSMCINHLTKITANDTHRRDDIADTLVDAVQIGLIDKSLYVEDTIDNTKGLTDLAATVNNQMAALSNLGSSHGYYR